VPPAYTLTLCASSLPSVSHHKKQPKGMTITHRMAMAADLVAVELCKLLPKVIAE